MGCFFSKMPYANVLGAFCPHVYSNTYNSSVRIEKELWEKSLYDPFKVVPTRNRCNLFKYICKGKSAGFETLLDSKLHIKMAKIHAVKKREPSSCAAVIPILVTKPFS